MLVPPCTVHQQVEISHCSQRIIDHQLSSRLTGESHGNRKACDASKHILLLNFALRTSNNPENQINHCTASIYRRTSQIKYEIEIIISLWHYLACVRPVSFRTKKNSFNLYTTKETQVWSLARRFWREISSFPPILPTFRPRQKWSLMTHSLGRTYLGGCLESSIPGFPSVHQMIEYNERTMKKIRTCQRRDDMREEGSSKKRRIKWKVEKRNSHLNTISTSCIYISIFIDLYSIWVACIDIRKYTSI